ncbi:hypothetical protein AB4K20DRAFT_1866676 [Rhizopus microsporus]|uniref:Uncharacterized protein n=1 Tax=Rhizopus microsporus TaxID=58291 RepID=A0A1X0RKZ5_RHIZD|nr:hypothetical protein BCV71DRAFT_259082 [Rhizopus microsporus]
MNVNIVSYKWPQNSALELRAVFLHILSKYPLQILQKYSELAPTRRWDDSQLEMELAEDDLIEEQRKKKFINSSLRLKLSENLKFRHSHSNSNNTPLFKRLYSWFT